MVTVEQIYKLTLLPSQIKKTVFLQHCDWFDDEFYQSSYNIDDDCINTVITTIFFIQNNNYFLQVQRRHFKENSHLCREILQLLMDRVSAQNNSIFY